MKQTAYNAPKRVLSALRNHGIDGRIFRSMVTATVVAVIASMVFAPWRVTTGLLLGGILSLFNHHWLSSSSIEALSVAAHGVKPRLRLAQYFLRYAVIAGLVFVAYQLDLVSLAATIIGLSSFVVALFVEAFRELYFAIIQREEIS